MSRWRRILQSSAKKTAKGANKMQQFGQQADEKGIEQAAGQEIKRQSKKMAGKGFRQVGRHAKRGVKASYRFAKQGLARLGQFMLASPLNFAIVLFSALVIVAVLSDEDSPINTGDWSEVIETQTESPGIISSIRSWFSNEDDKLISEDEELAQLISSMGDSCSVPLDTTGRVSGSVNLSPGKTKWSLDQVVSFATSPITSTFDVSDEQAASFFLTHINARTVITRYGLNSGNIGRVTKVVKDAGVSPVFFYIYAISEGGGAGGYINHWFQKDMTGDALQDARMDAEYLVQTSKVATHQPATEVWSLGNMPTAKPKEILDKMPEGSIGRAYIPSTAAVTMELNKLAGISWAMPPKYENYFGFPLSDMMSLITQLGGDPFSDTQMTIDGVANDCDDNPDTLTGTDREKVVKMAKKLLGVPYVWGGTTEKGVDCSGLIYWAYQNALDMTIPRTTYAMDDHLEHISRKDLKPGDMVLENAGPNGPEHVTMYIGNDQVIEAPQPGQNVHIRDIKYSKITGYVRVLGSKDANKYKNK